jgi:hypothetical protein
MDNNDIFPSWGDLDDGQESFWSADWFIDKDQDKDTIILTVTIDNEETFNWFYPEVYNAFHTDTVKEFLARYYKKEISDENIKEFKDFLFHWFQTVDDEGAMDMEFDDEFVNESDDVFVESENRTLH